MVDCQDNNGQVSTISNKDKDMSKSAATTHALPRQLARQQRLADVP